MHILLKCLTSTSLLSYLILGSILALPSFAEEETKGQRKQRLQDYYLVDFILFKHTDTSVADANYPEQWPKSVDVSLPVNPVQLMPANPLSIYPELKKDFSLLNKSTQQKLTDITPLSDKYMASRLPLTNELFSELRDESKKINQVKRYELLSQQSWVQKITRTETPKEILIPIDLTLNKDSNSEALNFDIDPEKTYVTGTIRIKKNRYLHLTTNLFAIQLLDTPAARDEAKIIEDKQKETLKMTEGRDNDAKQKPAITEAKNTSPWPRLTVNSRMLEQAYYAKTGLHASEQTPYPLTIPSEYIKQIAALKQTRRMRSKETHYIDHPLIGIVVRITPLVSVLDHHTK